MCTCMSKSLDLHEHKYNRRSIAISNPTKTRAILLGRGGGVVMGTAASVATSLLGEGCISAGGLADGDVAPDGTAVGIPEDTTSPGLAVTVAPVGTAVGIPEDVALTRGLADGDVASDGTAVDVAGASSAACALVTTAGFGFSAGFGISVGGLTVALEVIGGGIAEAAGLSATAKELESSTSSASDGLYSCDCN